MICDEVVDSIIRGCGLEYILEPTNITRQVHMAAIEQEKACGGRHFKYGNGVTIDKWCERN